MIPLEKIQAYADEVVQYFDPEQIILFGSYVNGVADDGSDVDLLVILPFEGSALEKSLEILRKTNPLFPLDLLAKTPQYIHSKKTMGNTFINDILLNGKTLYERRNS